MKNARQLVDLPDADITCVEIPIKQESYVKRLRIFSCYFPQGKSQQESQSLFFDFLSDLHTDFSNDLFIILGDFNIADAVWMPSNSGVSGYIMQNPNFNILTCQLSAFMNYTNWLQYNCIPNKNDRQLDLVLSNNQCEVTVVEPLVPIDTHHPVFCVKSYISNFERILKSAPRIARRFFAADYDLINAKLDFIDWKTPLCDSNVDDAVEKFYLIINEIINEFIPTKSSNSNDSKYPAWYSRYLISLIKKKKKYIKNGKFILDNQITTGSLVYVLK